jgi:hypothetical protein
MSAARLRKADVLRLSARVAACPVARADASKSGLRSRVSVKHDITATSNAAATSCSSALTCVRKLSTAFGPQLTNFSASSDAIRRSVWVGAGNLEISPRIGLQLVRYACARAKLT